MASWTRFALGNFLYAVGLSVAIFGFVALYAYLADGRGERWALAAMVLSVLGFVSTLMYVGYGAADSVAGELYLEGQQAFLERLYGSFIWLDFVGLVGGRLLLFIGFVLFGVAIWRSGALPRGAAILWVAASVLLPATALAGVWAQVIYFLLFTIANAWIALSVLRQPSEKMVGAEAQPRVR